MLEGVTQDPRAIAKLRMFKLCREFGWTPKQYREQNAKDVLELERMIDYVNIRQKREMDKARLMSQVKK